MPDWWGTFLVVAVSAGALWAFIVGLYKLVPYLLWRRSRASVVILSLMVAPSMFGTLAAINWLSEDKEVDVYGFERQEYERQTSHHRTRAARKVSVVTKGFDPIYRINFEVQARSSTHHGTRLV